jgi:glyoxylase-like metal-dependent hydrolase (beta-lactamase superfamily II)
MRFGEFELHSLLDGFFGLDGGAMFGVVPKPVWEKTNPADARNRIRLAARPLLVVCGADRVLIDTGIGDRWDEKAREIYRIEKPDTVETSLARAGFKPDDVTKVVLTHLHFDHAGATTKLDESGKPVPRFPNARHYVQRMEWEAALTPNRRSRASYRPSDFVPIKEAGLLELIDGDWKLDLTARDTIRNVGHSGHVPSFELVRTGGHTPGHQIVLVRAESEVRSHSSPRPPPPRGEGERSEGEEAVGGQRSADGVLRTAVFWGDLIPTGSHIATPYIMGYDLHPLETMEQKERLVRQAIAGNWLSFLEHDPDHACGTICEEDGRPLLKPPAA